jgi:hypothetical protein
MPFTASDTTRKIIGRIVIFTIVATVAIWQISRVRLANKKQRGVEHNINEMVAKHNALVDWAEHFVNNQREIDGGSRAIYTVDVESVLVRQDSQPILFYGGVADVKKQNGSYVAIFSMVEDIDIVFALTCNSVQVERILRQPEEYADSYAIVAAISDIERPKFEVDAYQYEGDELYVIVEPCDIFIANGVCLDLLFVGDYEN